MIPSVPVPTSPPPEGEYMLHDGSDSEDSFSDDGEGEEGDGGRGRGAEGEEAEKSDTIPVYVPLSLEAPTITSSEGGAEKEEKKEEGEEGEGEEGVAAAAAGEEDKGDPEMAPVYLKKMLPVFAELFHSSQAPTLRFSFSPTVTIHGCMGKWEWENRNQEVHYYLDTCTCTFRFIVTYRYLYMYMYPQVYFYIPYTWRDGCIGKWEWENRHEDIVILW